MRMGPEMYNRWLASFQFIRPIQAVSPNGNFYFSKSAVFLSSNIFPWCFFSSCCFIPSEPSGVYLDSKRSDPNVWNNWSFAAIFATLHLSGNGCFLPSVKKALHAKFYHTFIASFLTVNASFQSSSFSCSLATNMTSAFAEITERV